MLNELLFTLFLTQVGTVADENGDPIDGTVYRAPVVLADKCVGCGLCQTRCNVINVKEKRLLSESAIIIEAGDGNEDRLMSGSYIDLRNAESRRATSIHKQDSDGDYFVPDSNPSDIPLGFPGEPPDQ